MLTFLKVKTTRTRECSEPGTHLDSLRAHALRDPARQRHLQRDRRPLGTCPTGDHQGEPIHTDLA